MLLTLFKRCDGDVEGLQGLSVQVAFGLDLSCGSIDLQPALSVTVQFVTARHTTRPPLHKHKHSQT